jgi:hypothetical protein
LVIYHGIEKKQGNSLQNFTTRHRKIVKRHPPTLFQTPPFQALVAMGQDLVHVRFSKTTGTYQKSKVMVMGLSRFFID